MIRTLLTLVASLLMTACSGLLESNEPPQRQYWLEPADYEVPTPLMISLSVVPGLDSPHILALQPDQRLNHFAGARWVSSSEQVLNSVFERSFRAQDPTAPAETLAIEMTRFFASYANGTDVPTVEMSANVNRCSGQLTFAVRAEIRANSNRLQDIVAAFQASLNQIAAQIADAASATSRQSACAT